MRRYNKRKKRKKKKESNNSPSHLRKKNLPLLGRLPCKNLQTEHIRIPSEYRLWHLSVMKVLENFLEILSE